MRPTRLHNRNLLAAAVIIGASVAGCTSAMAGTFDVKGPEIEKGSREAELGFAWQDGFSNKAEPLRHSWELEFGYGVTD